MNVLLRVLLVWAGCVLMLGGLVRVAWAMWSWAVLAWLHERPALVGENPRVRYRVEVLVAATGAALVVAGIAI